MSPKTPTPTTDHDTDGDQPDLHDSLLLSSGLYFPMEVNEINNLEDLIPAKSHLPKDLEILILGIKDRLNGAAECIDFFRADEHHMHLEMAHQSALGAFLLLDLLKHLRIVDTIPKNSCSAGNK